MTPDERTQLLDELMDGQTLLETLSPKSRVDELEEEVRFLRSVVGVLADRVKALEAAG